MSMDVAKKQIKRLLFDDVIDNTFGVMTRLNNALGMLDHADPELVDLLLQMSSESIREALHKHELSITNSIISHKLRILKATGVPIPESGHGIINAKDYAHNW